MSKTVEATPKRNRKLPTGKPPISKCRYCGRQVKWLQAPFKLKPIPVDLDTATNGYAGEAVLFDIDLGHRAHWNSCPEYKTVRKEKSLPSLAIKG